MEYLFKAADGGKLHNASFNNLEINPSHPSGVFIMRTEDRGNGLERIETKLKPYIGIDDREGEKIYIGSILSFTFESSDKNDMFYNSNVGKEFATGLYDEIVILVREHFHGFLGFSYDMYFRKEGRFLTERECDEEGHANMPETKGHEIEKHPGLECRFLNYLSLKNGLNSGLKVIGNDTENMDLLPKIDQ